MIRHLSFALSLAFALAVFSAPETVNAADHLDAPSIMIDGRMDINDTYIFQSPTNPENTIMIMTVNPLAGILSPSTFSPTTEYGFDLDRDGDAVPDLVIAVRFSGLIRSSGKQRISVRYRFGNESVLAARGRTGEDVRLRGGGRLRADLFDDPFFFDLIGFQNGFAFSGMDFFEGFNVSAIVIEYPRARLAPDNISLVGRTSVNGVQVDRFGRPAINTVLIPSDRKDEYNTSLAVDDFDAFGDDVRSAITGLSGDADYAEMLTAVLLPDVMTFDQSSTDGFLNGRQLFDDVIDAELNLLTMGGVTTDMVDGNDVKFPGVWPFLAPPH